MVGLILLVGIVFITLRMRRRQRSDGGRPIGPFQGTAVLDKSHPAARIIPFGTPGQEGHYFSESLTYCLYRHLKNSNFLHRSRSRKRYADSHSTA
jgi:hypothetical protein